jgi:hypothetical protein
MQGYLIWSIEHEAWWAPNEMGYTTRLDDAGHYTEHDTIRILSRANAIEINECKIPLRCVMTSIEASHEAD